MVVWFNRFLILVILLSLGAIAGMFAYDFNGFKVVFWQVIHPPFLYIILAPAGIILAFILMYGLTWLLLNIVLAFFRLIFGR